MKERIINFVKFIIAGLGVGAFGMLMTTVYSINRADIELNSQFFIVIYFIVLPLVFGAASLFARTNKQTTGFNFIKFATWAMATTVVMILLVYLCVALTGGPQ